MAAREFSFTSFQANNPTAPPPGDRLDGEFDRLAKAVATLPLPAPVKIGKNQLEPGLFDQIGSAVAARVEALAGGLRGLLQEASALAAASIGAAGSATGHNARAQDAASRSTSEAQDAASSAAAAAASANAAQASAADASNDANHADGAAALAEDWGQVSFAWAEHMPDIIPPDILATMGVSGDHWSSRWWANRAAEIFDENHVGPPGPTGPAGPTGAQGPPGAGSVAGMTTGQIPIAASATGIASSANLSGDVTSSAALAVTLKTVNANVGSFQGLTVNAKGLVTAAADQSYATTAAMNTADALKVAKTGDAMTGSLSVKSGTQPLKLQTDDFVQASVGSEFYVDFGTATGDTYSALYAMRTGAFNWSNLVMQSGGGNVGIGTTAPGAKLEVRDGVMPLKLTTPDFVQSSTGSTLYAVFGAPSGDTYTALRAMGQGAFAWNNLILQEGGGKVALGTTSPGSSYFTVNGVCANQSGAWTTISDAQAKEDVSPYTRGLDAIVALNPVQFRYREGFPYKSDIEPDNRFFFGLLADDVRAVVPEIVGSTMATVGDKETELGTLEPGNLIYALINSVKTLAAKVAALEAAAVA